jgi:glycosyltransferase involved in cell wall biosynthesis
LLIYKPDIVYFTCAPSVGFAFRDAPQILLSKIFGRKVVIHLRGGRLEGFWGGGLLRRFLTNMGSRLADYIFVITRDCEAVARKKFGNNKVIYVPNFIDTKSISEAGNDVPAEIKKGKFNIIHVAFQCKVKGTFEIIQAAKQLPDQVNILLIGIVSEGYRIAIEEAIQENRVTDKVQLLGTRGKPELWDYYRNADLFLFPTYSEGFPNVIMEAMLYGLPILTTDVGNVAEMTDVHGKKPSAVLLEKAGPADPIEIATKVKDLINNTELRKQLSENGFKRVRQSYSIDVLMPQLEAVLQAISLRKDVLAESRKYFQQNENSI